jgi:beta-1,4-N-acetylglucosaminyltransferase
MRRRRPLCIIASAGGHLVEALKATAWLQDYEKFYVTFRIPYVQETLNGQECFFISFPSFNPAKYILNLTQSLWIYIRKRPAIIITTGGGMAVPLCTVGRIFGSQIVFIESGARVDLPSRASKILCRVAHLCLVQWRPLLAHYPGAVYGGPLL